MGSDSFAMYFNIVRAGNWNSHSLFIRIFKFANGLRRNSDRFYIESILFKFFTLMEYSHHCLHSVFAIEFSHIKYYYPSPTPVFLVLIFGTVNIILIEIQLRFKDYTEQFYLQDMFYSGTIKEIYFFSFQSLLYYQKVQDIDFKLMHILLNIFIHFFIGGISKV